MAHEKEYRITVPLDEDDHAALEKHVARMKSSAAKGVQITRTDAIRNVVKRGLADAERAR